MWVEEYRLERLEIAYIIEVVMMFAQWKRGCISVQMIITSEVNQLFTARKNICFRMKRVQASNKML